MQEPEDQLPLVLLNLVQWTSTGAGEPVKPSAHVSVTNELMLCWKLPAVGALENPVFCCGFVSQYVGFTAPN